MSLSNGCMAGRKKLVIVAAFGAWAVVASPAAAQETASPMAPPKAPREIPDDVRSAWACVAGGSAGTAAALAAGAENLINVVAGGVVAPSNRSVMVLGLAGVVFTTFCTLGQQLLPLVDHYAPWGPAAGPADSETARAETPAKPQPAPMTSSFQSVSDSAGSAAFPAVFVEETTLVRF